MVVCMTLLGTAAMKTFQLDLCVYVKIHNQHVSVYVVETMFT